VDYRGEGGGFRGGVAGAQPAGHDLAFIRGHAAAARQTSAVATSLETVRLRSDPRLEEHLELRQDRVLRGAAEGEGVVGLVDAVGRDLADELLERHREVVAEEGGEEVDPALELGGLHAACGKRVK
jgi:hypothetical protein